MEFRFMKAYQRVLENEDKERKFIAALDSFIKKHKLARQMFEPLFGLAMKNIDSNITKLTSMMVDMSKKFDDQKIKDDFSNILNTL
ncbi:MAG TPA: hypothetical protein PLA71_00890 [Saccharofermentans sp.]|nr:hypothetical protein [Saccharofermentans sp.]